MTQSIGSYLSLELQKRNEFIYHPNSVYLNTGRNALELILKVINVEKLYIPYLYCDSILTPLRRLNIKYEFYKVGNSLEPIVDFSLFMNGTYLLLINYLGLKDKVVNDVTKKTENVIVDNTQSFFSYALEGIPTFYSTRKFFGVADGALLCNMGEGFDLKKDSSSDRMQHLIKRVENPSEVAYDFYNRIEDELDKLPIMYMSDLTKEILLSIDFSYHKRVRNENFFFLHKKLEQYNKYQFDKNINDLAPLAYPLWVENAKELRSILVDNRIFTPRYWPNVINEMSESTIEYQYSQHIIPIPVDKRYNSEILKKVTDIIDGYFRNA